MNKMKLIIVFIFLAAAIHIWAEVVVYLDPTYGSHGKEVQLSLEGLASPDFPRPINHNPVLFVHGHHFINILKKHAKKTSFWDEVPKERHQTDREWVGGATPKSYQRDWQHPFNGLPCFRETLELAENSWLEIEPYYIDLEDYRDDEEKKNRSIEADALKIQEAVNLILLHQGDPGATNKKVAIIAYGKGAISARFYLDKLWKEQNRRLSFHPVSALIAISPPNHGFPADRVDIMDRDSLQYQQLTNGYDENCSRFPDPSSHDFIEKLNGHPIYDTMADNYCASIFDSEAPGSRRNNEPAANGILYVTLYARGNRDIVGGSDPSGDCQGRVLAKNLAPNAENREIPGIPDPGNYPEIPGGKDKLAVHQNTVHMPEVICKALYTVVHHQAPPDELIFAAAEQNNQESPPIVPRWQPPQQDEAVVLLFDISHSMSWQSDRYDETPGTEEDRQPLTLVKKAVEPFMRLLSTYWDRKKNIGIAVFPALPWSCELQKDGCAQTINPLTPVTEANIHQLIKTIHCLRPQGYTPLFKGIDTALPIFGQEKHKSIILISDGFHNFPTPVNTNDVALEAYIKDLDQKQVTLYAVGFGRNQYIDVNHNLLARLALDREPHLQGKFFRVTDPGMTLTGSLKSIFTTFMNLETVKDYQGTIKTGETVTDPVKINKYDRKISFLLSRETAGQEKLGFFISSPDGKPVANDSPGVTLHVGETFTIITLDERILRQPGKPGTNPWKINIDAHDLENGRQVDYFYSVITDSALKMKTGFDKATYETGDTIIVKVEITEGEQGQPLTGLTDVTAVVTRPREGQGNWYALNKISPAELESIPGTIGEESLSRQQRKAIYLARERSGVLALLSQRTGPLVVHLYDDGSHGDKTKADGIYTNQYTDVIKEGTYCFRFRAAGEQWEREKIEEVMVVPKPHPAYSSLDIRWYDTTPDDPPQYLYHLELVPKDPYGNFIGPGHTVEVNIHYKKEQSPQPIKLNDCLDGTYTGETGISPRGLKTGMQLVFTIDGQPFTTVEKIPGFKKRSLGVYAGMGIPTYSFSRGRGININSGCHFGYQLSTQFSLVGMVGYNRFSSDSSSYNPKEKEWWNISANLQSEVFKIPFRIYVDAGPGIYISGCGVFTPGFNFGLGAAYSLKSDWGVQLGTNYHHLFTKGVPDPNFLVTYARLLYHF